MLTSGSRGRGWPSRQRVAKIGFFEVPRPCERAEAATKTSWESREGFSSGGRGEWAGAEMPTSVSRVAEQATGGSETVDATKGQRGQGMSPCLAPLQGISIYTGPVHRVPYNQGRPGRHGSPLPGGLTMATLSGGGAGLYLEPGVPTRPASV